MEEAISGPVDKDTSSYGDRTASSPNTGSGMMLAMPANGNLNNMAGDGQQQQQQQASSDEQQKAPGMEIEREAGPIEGSNSPPMDSQQQTMEQKSARQQQGQRNQERMSGRLNSAPSMMAGGPARSGRQQQQAESDYASKGAETSFGEEPAMAANGAKRPMGPATKQEEPSSQAGYGRQAPGKAGASESGASYDESEQQQSGPNEQRPMNGADPRQQQEMGYTNGDDQMAAKQKAMAAMLMTVSNGMKYSRSSAMVPSMSGNGGSMTGGQYGDKKPSSMAQNMMMSLANKAAYMGQQQMVQRQTAPPMMMMNAYNRNQMGANGAMGGNAMNAMPMNRNGMRGMRRANQRRVEKKMSPAMVNAMLNKMVNMKLQEQGGSSRNGNGYRGPSAMAMMKTPMGAEMLANMMMPQMVGAMEGMPAAKKEQYKRMMMAAIMQQSQASASDYPNEAQEQQRSQEPSDSYGGKQQSEEGGKQMADMSEFGKPAGAGGYGGAMGTMSPVDMMMNLMNGAATGNSYGENEQQKQMEGSEYANGAQNRQTGMAARSPMSSYGNDEQQEQQRQSMDGLGSYGAQQQRDLMIPPIMNGATAKTMSRSMANKPMSMATYGPSSGAMSMANGGRSPMMMNKYGSGDNEEQKQTGMGGYGASEGDQQQREMAPTMRPEGAMGGATKSAGGQEGAYPSAGMDSMAPMMMMNGRAPSMPMNGFRQSYNQQQRMNEKPASGSYSAQASAGTKGDYAPPTMAPTKSMSGQQGYEQQPQQQLDDYGAAPMGQAEPFAFDYKIEDDYGNGQYRKEESDKNGVVRGSYGYKDVSGIYRHVEYVADENGFRANIKSNEPGLSSESGGKPSDSDSQVVQKESGAGGQQMTQTSEQK